ncbi:MAG: hypothetical protein ACE5H5_04525 [Nitrospinota bacterium]
MKQVGEVIEVVLELRGLDAEGAGVSQRLLRVDPLYPLFEDDTWPFAIRFTPSGREARYVLDVWAYDIGATADGDGVGE